MTITYEPGVGRIVLPKWPQLVVKGASVKPYQAVEILIQTSVWMPYTNNPDLTKMLEQIVGVPSDDSIQRYLFVDEWCRARGILPLEYLHNDRIASAYIFGAKGWCNWDGNIACSGFNIGKYPSVDEVANEWELILAEFPYLDLDAWLYSGEYCEDNTRPLVQFSVRNGLVHVKPAEPGRDPAREVPDTNGVELVANKSNSYLLVEGITRIWHRREGK